MSFLGDLGEDLVLVEQNRIRFDGKRTPWTIRATACDGRYRIATCSMFGVIRYTIIDLINGERGAMNVIGGGLDIFTTSGPDEAIDRAVQMLEADDGWGISHRNRVPLSVTP